MTRPRFLLGTMEICNQLSVWATALQQMGYDVETVVARKNPYYMDSTYDHVIDHGRIHSVVSPDGDTTLGSIVNNWDTLSQLRHFLMDFDVYVFQWGCSIVGRLNELSILKSLGKTVICFFCGSDLRTPSAFQLHCRNVGVPPHPFGLQNPDPTGSLNSKVSIIRLAELYADAIIGAPDYMGLAIRPYFMGWGPLDISSVPHGIPGRAAPVVVHAPSRREGKGTSKIITAVERLQTEGVQFTFELLEKVPNHEVKRRLAMADIAVDQIYSEYPGTFAKEAMAAGCAVATGFRPDTTLLPPDTPCIDIKPDSIYLNLKKLILDREFRMSLALRGREFVLKNYHPLVSIARILDTVARSRRNDFDYHPRLFVDEYHPPGDEPLTVENRKLTLQSARMFLSPADQAWERMANAGLI